MKHLVSLADWSPQQIADVLALALELKRDPAAYREALRDRTLIMLFEKPSLRTRVSFETGATQMGGHAIHYDLGTSPLGAGKETIEDTARVLSRYVDLVMARLFEHRTLRALARHATVPVINGLTDHAHPTQILADLLTLRERKGRLKGLKLAYLGDSRNNVTHSLLIGCAKCGIDITVGCPPEAAFQPDPAVLRRARTAGRRSGAGITVTDRAAEAVRGADAVYTDSWMSYHIDPAAAKARCKALRPYRVTAALMKRAARNAVFMNCLPAMRGYEQTSEVIDGPQSVVFDEAENRLHAHKAVMLKLLEWSARPAAR